MMNIHFLWWILIVNNLKIFIETILETIFWTIIISNLQQNMPLKIKPKSLEYDCYRATKYFSHRCTDKNFLSAWPLFG